MTMDELRQAAIECLARTFKSNSKVPPHVVQAAVSVLMIQKSADG